MQDNIHPLPSRGEPNQIKAFLNKPVHESTVGDALVMHTATVLISVLVPMAVQGWVILIQRSKTSQNLHSVE